MSYAVEHSLVSVSRLKGMKTTGPERQTNTSLFVDIEIAAQPQQKQILTLNTDVSQEVW